jgi:H/ACA ribonucleoprotein complex subunit 3
MRRCQVCGTYTLKDVCVKDNAPTAIVGPARYSPQDPYGKYRRLMKERIASG